jgi:citrate lyase subunit beta/citryl-CoA lyase
VTEALRSLLFVPGDRPDMVAKVGRSGPDAVAVDLEDAVAADAKDDARAAALAELARERPGAGLVLLRLNPPGSPWHADDVRAAASCVVLDGVVLPKYETPDQLARLRASLPDGMRVVVGVETVRGVLDARPLLEAGPDAAYLGSEDLIADLGGRRTAAGLEVAYARGAVRLAAHLAGVPVLDQATVAVHDEDAFRRESGEARDLGYQGKICLHPRQVALAHELFTPSDEEVAHARAVLEAARSSGVAVVDGQMVDAVHVTMARSVLDRAGVSG